MTGIADGVTAANSQAFGYDALDRLHERDGEQYGSFAWTYDKVGNRLTQTLAGATTAYGYAAGTNLLANITSGGAASPVSRTPAGNIAGIGDAGGVPASLTYNAANRLQSVSGGAEAIANMIYDASGHRFSKTDGNGESILFTYGEDGPPAGGDGDPGVKEIDYVYLDGRPAAEIQPLSGDALLFFTTTGWVRLSYGVTDASETVVWAAHSTTKLFGATAAPFRVD